MSPWLKFLTVSVCAMALVQSGAAQDVGPADTAEASDEQVTLEADLVYENSADNTIVAEGNVEALYEGRILRADRLVYNRTTERVRASGNVVIIDATGAQQFSDEVEVDASLANGYAIGFSARLPDGGTMVANSAIRQEGGINALDQIVYTSCEICEEDTTPTWSIRARRAVLDQEAEMYSYRDAVIEIAGVPVFYLPYLAHPDPTSGRKSGFLVPSGGLSSKLGVNYQQPYHWVISDHSDLTIAPLVTANVNPLLELDYRKRFYSGAIDINTSVTYESDFDSDGNLVGDPSWRSHVYGKGLFAITPEWQWGFGVERQSDDLYDRRYDIDGQGDRRGPYKSQPRRLLSQLFAIGQGDTYYADVAALSFQGLRSTDDPGNLPTVTPIAYADRYFDLGNWGFASVNASSGILTRSEGIDSQRVSVGAEWSDLSILPGGITVKPFAEIRGDYYGLDEAFSGKDSVTRAVGNTGLELSYPLVRPGKHVDIMVEPTLMGAWGFTNTNDDAIPNEDSVLFELDESNLFHANGFGNYDLFEGDGKLSAGLSTRAVWKGGTELNASLGRRWRSRSDDAFDVSTNLDGTTSDWIATFGADLGDILSLNTRMRLDDDGFNLNRIDVRASSRYRGLRAVVEYYKIDEQVSPRGVADEGIFLRGEYRVLENYSLIFGQLRDITTGLNAKTELGVAYEDDCSRFELVYFRTEVQDRLQGPNDSIQFRFTLKSLGEFGSSNFD